MKKLLTTLLTLTILLFTGQAFAEKTIVAYDYNVYEVVPNEIKRLGNDADLNHIDVSNVTVMWAMFEGSKFNGNISNWDVSNVTDMSNIFKQSKFNGDISNWDVSNVTNMASMFNKSKFNGDISKWDVSNVKYMESMFRESNLNRDISKWDVSRVIDMDRLDKQTLSILNATYYWGYSIDEFITGVFGVLIFVVAGLLWIRSRMKKSNKEDANVKDKDKELKSDTINEFSESSFKKFILAGYIVTCIVFWYVSLGESPGWDQAERIIYTLLGSAFIVIVGVIPVIFIYGIMIMVFVKSPELQDATDEVTRLGGPVFKNEAPVALLYGSTKVMWALVITSIVVAAPAIIIVIDNVGGQWGEFYRISAVALTALTLFWALTIIIGLVLYFNFRRFIEAVKLGALDGKSSSRRIKVTEAHTVESGESYWDKDLMRHEYRSTGRSNIEAKYRDSKYYESPEQAIQSLHTYILTTRIILGFGVLALWLFIQPWFS